MRHRGEPPAGGGLASPPRPARAAVIALAALAVAAGIWMGVRAPDPVPVAIEAVAGSMVDDPRRPDPPGPTSSALVHVSGAVAAPGLVTVGEGDRVADAISGAGGALPAADLTSINLAGPVSDGQQIVVPWIGGGAGAGASPPGRDDGLVHLNTATAADLERLPGVGEVLAQRIVAYREANGPFGAVEDLLDIPGIGERKLEGLRDIAVVP